MDITADFIDGLGQINIFLGKNGSGKSTILRNMKSYFEKTPQDYGYISYIVPERGGWLQHEAGIDNAMKDPNRIGQQRRGNLSSNFKLQSISLYSEIELKILKELQKKVDENSQENLKEFTMKQYIEYIATLLDNIILVEEDKKKFFTFKDKNTGSPISHENISSGESELICLGIEILAFFIYSGESNNYLLLDEPDTHLHPDLQVKLIKYLNDLILKFSYKSIKIVIATHSTALIGGVNEFDLECKVYFIHNKELQSTISSIGDMHKKILPIFGAHPLSQIFSSKPIIIVEGENDEIIIQQMLKSSGGKINLYPCVAGSKPEIHDYESEATSIMKAVYDTAKGYSLRDGDGTEGDLQDTQSIIRIRLQCYEMENVLLSDELLEKYDTDWDTLKGKLSVWVDGNLHHQDVESVKQLLSTGDRKSYKISDFVNIITSAISNNKPRQFMIGQTLGQLSYDDKTDYTRDSSIYNFLGEKFVKSILPKN